MEDVQQRVACMFSQDAAVKKRKRWSDGFIAYSAAHCALRVLNDTECLVTSMRCSQADVEVLMC